MRRSSVLSLIFALVVAMSAVASCSSSGRSGKASGTSAPSSTAGPTSGSGGWPPSGLGALRALAIRLQKSAPGQCSDVQSFPFDQYAATARRLHLDPPAYVADCDVFGDTIELNVFSSTNARESFMKQRTEALCRVAAAGRTLLTALHWVTGTDYAVQFKNEGPARRIARALRGDYSYISCPGATAAVWDAAGERRVEQLVAQLASRPQIKCADAQLLDRVQYDHDDRYKGRVPAAYLACAGPGSTAINIAAFNVGTVNPRAFADAETRQMCGGTAHGIEAVVGSDFAIIATNVKVAALVAEATGGTALPPAC